MIKSLQQRLTLLLLLPVALFLFLTGLFGFIYARGTLLDEWRETAILKLQRAAHHIDMRLSRPIHRIEMFHETAGGHGGHTVQEWILRQLKELEGVTEVKLRWAQNRTQPVPMPSHRLHMGGKGMMHFHRGRISKVTPPHYDAQTGQNTVTLISELIDEAGGVVGRLEVALRFDSLMQDIRKLGWWQSDMACLVDVSGQYLAHTEAMMRGRARLGETYDPLELAILEAMKERSFGTIFGSGHPPDRVSGFYKLKQAPWTIILFAPGERILAPIVRFRLYYAIAVTLCIVLILLLIRFVTGRMAHSIRSISKAAKQVAKGSYGAPLPVQTQDEIGDLVRSFNTMVLQLEERMRLKHALDLAMEVQQNLLPQKLLKLEGVDIAGESIYCDETGGDYYDFLQFSELGQGRVGIAVGDVVGHGIAAALLMATVRAFLRIRVTQPGSLSEMIVDVNRLLCIDTAQTGSFMTLFFMTIDSVKRDMRWVRAGHDPAIVYNPSMGSFSELGGSGIALGIDDSWSFQEYTHSGWSNGEIILIGTDGIWETQSPQGDAYGKDRLRQVIRQRSESSSQEIVLAITDDVAAFRQSAIQNDDITLVVVKTEP